MSELHTNSLSPNQSQRRIIEPKLPGSINLSIAIVSKQGLVFILLGILKTPRTGLGVFKWEIFFITEKSILIASGGVMNASDVKERLINSADLVQLYTGYIYQGNSLLKKALKISSS